MANGWYTSLHTVCHTVAPVCHTAVLYFPCMQGILVPIVNCFASKCTRICRGFPSITSLYYALFVQSWYSTVFNSYYFQIKSEEFFFSTTMVKHYNQPLQHGSPRRQPQRGWNFATITGPQHTILEKKEKKKFTIYFNAAALPPRESRPTRPNPNLFVAAAKNTQIPSHTDMYFEKPRILIFLFLS